MAVLSVRVFWQSKANYRVSFIAGSIADGWWNLVLEFGDDEW
jgi:hypothetical protein